MCLFFDPHLITHQSNIDLRLKSNQMTPAYLTLSYIGPCTPHGSAPYFIVHDVDPFDTTKVDAPKSNPTVIWTPIFEWQVVMCAFENKH